MPRYEYQCERCGIRFERFQSFGEMPVRVCPECSGPVRRLIFPAGLVFKGPGFYITDSRKGSESSGNGSKGEKKEEKA